jgi:hypothetical protein
MSVTITTMTNEEARLEFFNEQIKQHRQKLHWWKHQKPHKQYSLVHIMERCSYHGDAIAYLQSAIDALEQEDK